MSKMMEAKKYRILFVCLGNICRSPAAEGIMRKMIEEKGLQNKLEVDSAGTSGYHDGEFPDQRMRRYGRQRGYSFDSVSRGVRMNDFDDFDLICAMDDSNYSYLMKLSSDLESQAKIHRMIEFSRKYDYDHIPDPYYSGNEGFELVIDLLEDACEGLLAQINNQIL